MRVMTSLRGAAAVVALTIAAAGAFAQDVKLPPVDEGATDLSWITFKARLLEALAKRDHKFVLGMVDGRIRNTSDTDGLSEFRKLWEPQSATSALWTELPKLLFLGGVFVKPEKGPTEYCAPYIHFRWPDDAPPDASGAILSKEALMKTAASAAAETLQVLSYDLVKVLDWEVADDDRENNQKWTKIQTRAGTGYVPEEQVRSPLEYRACFARSTAGWRMTGLELGE